MLQGASEHASHQKHDQISAAKHNRNSHGHSQIASITMGGEFEPTLSPSKFLVADPSTEGFLASDAGFVASDATAQDLTESAREGAVSKAKNALMVLSGFFAIMSLGVWYVFRKRGRIYI